MNILDQMHWVKGLDPIADAFAGTVTSDVVECWGGGVLFIIYKGVGATGTSTITVLACDDVVPTTTTAVAFMYRTCVATDVWGSWTQALPAGFTTTAGSSQLYQIYVPQAELATEGRGYAQLQAVEVVNNPVLGGILIAVTDLKYGPAPESLID
jgi:hypothetical protein